MSLFLRTVILVSLILLVPTPASAQDREPAATVPPIISEMVSGGSYRLTGSGARENVIFVEWELPNHVYSMTTVLRNRRVLDIGRINDDGTVAISSSIGLTTGRVTANGALVSEGTQEGRRVVQETTVIAPGRFLLRFTIDGGPEREWRIEQIPLEEAHRIAARLYPAEYRAHNPAPLEPPSQIRNALVVGVSNYANLPTLPNPTNDARIVARELTALHYRVELVIDPTNAAFNEALSRFRAAVAAAPPGSPALFYYAGHAVEIRGSNFLLPADMASRPADIASEAIPVASVLSQLAAARNSTRVLILDACRNGPPQWPGIGTGLAQVSAPEGTYIAYSTAPGMVAFDGAGRNSPFASALAEELGSSQQPIEEVFRNVRRSVLLATGGQQIPWDSSSLLEPFYFQN